MTLNGIQTPLGITDPADFQGAMAEFRSLIGQAKETLGVAPNAVKPGRVADLVPTFLAAKKGRVAVKTHYGYGCYLKRFMAAFGNSTINGLTAEAIETDSHNSEWSSSNRHNYLFTVQAFVRWANRNDFVLHRPPKTSRGADAFIDDRTAAMIFRETTGDFHQLLRFLWFTGCRPMEAARLKAEDVNTLNGAITLREHKTAHQGKKRIIYAGPQAMDVLRDQIQRHTTGALFRGQRGEQLSIQAIVTRFLRLSEKLGRSVTAYHFRHTFITRALLAGTPDTHVAAMVGHSNTTMIHKHYSHVAQQSSVLLGQAARLEGVLNGAGQGGPPPAAT